MASNQENKKSRIAEGETSARQGASRKSAPQAATITAVVPVQAIAAAQWDQDGDDGLASALRVFFLSHTLDPLTGEVHTVH